MVVGEFVWVSVLFLVLRLEKGLRHHLQSWLIFSVLVSTVFSSQPTLTHLKCNCCRAGLSLVTAKTDPFLFKPLFILEVVFHISQDHVACWYVHVGGCGFFTPETNENFLYTIFLQKKKGQTHKCCWNDLIHMLSAVVLSNESLRAIMYYCRCITMYMSS